MSNLGRNDSRYCEISRNQEHVGERACAKNKFYVEAAVLVGLVRLRLVQATHVDIKGCVHTNSKYGLNDKKQLALSQKSPLDPVYRPNQKNY